MQPILKDNIMSNSSEVNTHDFYEICEGESCCRHCGLDKEWLISDDETCPGDVPFGYYD
jgi:hypothetical protein